MVFGVVLFLSSRGRSNSSPCWQWVFVFCFFLLFSRLKFFLMSAFFGLLKYTAKTRVKIFSIASRSCQTNQLPKCEQEREMLSYRLTQLTKFSQGIFSAIKDEWCAVVFSPGFGQAFQTSQVLQNLGWFQLVPPLVDTRTEIEKKN